MTDTVTPATTGPVTLDDVRAALGETDPRTTNSGALRRALGRGSLSTIQKHLDAIRSEGAAQALEVSGGAPDAPKDLLNAIWTHAWSSAQARTMGALAAAQAAEASTASALAVAQADAESAQSEADQALAELEAVKAQADAAAQAYATELEAVKTEAAQALQAQAQELAEARAALAASQAAQALAQAQHDAGIAALRGEVDRLVSQLADLRAALGRPAPAAGEQAQRRK